MTQERDHSPLPWITNSLEDGGYVIKQHNECGRHLARTYKTTQDCAEENAAFIVRACNNHYKLVERVREMVEAINAGAVQSKPINSNVGAWDFHEEWLKYAQEALAEAEAA